MKMLSFFAVKTLLSSFERQNYTKNLNYQTFYQKNYRKTFFLSLN